jgi:hypothetical protein
VKATIELEGSPAELGRALRLMGHGLESEEPQSETPGPENGTAGWWTPRRADRSIREIKDNARLGLAAICERAPETSFEAVQEQIGLDGIRTGGAMASIGFAVSRMRAPKPFVRDYNRRVYIIEPNVARVLLEAIERSESE